MFKLTPFSATPRVRRRDDLTDFIDDFFTTPFRTFRNEAFRIDVEEQDNAYVIKADMPGIEKDEVKVTYDDQVLNISVNRDEEKTENEEEGKNYLYRERRVHSMHRAIHLPDVDPSKLKAKLENGVLHVTAEKSEVQDQGYVVDVE